MNNRSYVELTGVTEVVSFDPAKVVLDSVCGQIIIKGTNLHVNVLSLDNGELQCDGKIDACYYSQAAKKVSRESLVSRLLR